MGLLKELVKKLGRETVEDPEYVKEQEKAGEDIADEIATRLMPKRDFVQKVDVSGPPVEISENKGQTIEEHNEDKMVSDESIRDEGDER